MSEASIMMDFKKAKQQADSIDAIADRLSNLSCTSFDDTMKTLSSDWKGDSASTYLNKCLTLQGALDDTVTSIRTTADTIREIARRVYEAELKNLEIAQKRKAAEEKSKETRTYKK
ncbi:WXG100 family type VII secretion target [Anaerosporobacter sp.]